MNTMTIEERLSAILDDGCPLSELLYRLSDLCEESKDDSAIVEAIRYAGDEVAARDR